MNLSILAQLMGGFAIIVVLLIAVFGVSFMGMNSMAAATDEIVHTDVPADVSVRELEVLILNALGRDTIHEGFASLLLCETVVVRSGVNIYAKA